MDHQTYRSGLYQHAFKVPNSASAQTWLELRGSVDDTLLGRSERFHVRVSHHLHICLRHHNHKALCVKASTATNLHGICEIAIRCYECIVLGIAANVKHIRR